jgi:hypothetical protein
MSKAEVIAKLVEAGHEDLAEQLLSDQDVKKVASLTKANNHIEARIYIAEKILKNKKFASAYKAMLQLRSFFGSVPHSLGTLEYEEMYQPLMKLAESQLSPADYQRLYAAT